MELEEWIAALAAKVYPPDRPASRRTIEYLLPRLNDLPAAWFTENSIDGLFRDLRTLNSADRVRKALRDFHGTQQTEAPLDHAEARIRREREQWGRRQDELRAEWDDPDGIRARIRTCNGELRFLRLLAGLVNKWAPQHLGLLPPAAIASLQTEAGEWSPPIVEPPPIRAAYLSPTQLDVLNPLPNGRKRTDAPATAASAAEPRAAPVGPDAA